MSRQPPAITYHLTPATYYDNFRNDDPYTSETFDAEGFIHCTDGVADLLLVANRYYRNDPRDYVALLIERARVEPEIRYEDEARIYPHIYGPLNRDAISAVFPVLRTDDGAFVSLDEESQRRSG